MKKQLFTASTRHYLVDVMGIDLDSVSRRERLLSTLGGFLGILLIIYVNGYFVHDWSAALIVASMGASAVLLFAVPHGKLSQPWPLVGGHLVSALVGVTCFKLIPDTATAAALAVGLAIGAMHYLRCIHPPGGATALTFVIGSSQLHAFGYSYVFEPVFINVMVILVVAVIFNLPFATRRYPQGLQNLMARDMEKATAQLQAFEIERDDIARAIEKMDIVVDLTDEDLVKLFHLASSEAKQRHMSTQQILLGHYFTNGGEQWSVRQIVDESMDRDQVIYRIIAGHEKRGTGVCTIEEFARWARLEVERDGHNWKQVTLKQHG